MDDNFLVVKPINGLANRLRVLLSYKILAEHLKFKFGVYWTSSSGFDDTKISELINISKSELDLYLINDVSWNQCRKLSFQIDKNISGVNEIPIDFANIKNQDLFCWRILNGKYSKMTSIACNLPCWSFGFNYDNLFSNHKILYKNLAKKIVVSDKIKETASKIYNKFSENTLGVHIRLGDATDTKNPKYKMHTKKMVETYLELCKQHKGKIYLSTDDKNTQNLFLNKFGNRILVSSKTFVESKLNQTKNGQFDAMIDMYLLSKTESMLPTSPSSFGKFASDMGGDLYSKCNINQSLSNDLQSVIYW